MADQLTDAESQAVNNPMYTDAPQTIASNPSDKYNADIANLYNSYRTILAYPDGNPDKIKGLQSIADSFRGSGLASVADDILANVIPKSQQQAQQDQYKQQWMQQIQATQTMAQPIMQNLQDPNALNAMYERAQTQARNGLASEYASRGLSGSGEYQAGLAAAATDLQANKQRELQQRQAQALSIQQGLAQQAAQPYQFQTQADLNSAQLKLGQQQFDWQKNYQQQQLNEQQSANTWSKIGDVAKVGGTLAAAALAPSPMTFGAAGAAIGSGLSSGQQVGTQNYNASPYGNTYGGNTYAQKLNTYGSY